MGWLRPAVRDATTASPALSLPIQSLSHASLSVCVCAPAQESLLEPKASWEDVHDGPPPDGPVPCPEVSSLSLSLSRCACLTPDRPSSMQVTAANTRVDGLRIGCAGADELHSLDTEKRKAHDCDRASFLLEEPKFDFAPLAVLCGVPLMFRRLGSDGDVGVPGGPAGPQAAPVEELRYETKMYVYKLMTTPGLGLPLTWNQHGPQTRLPPVLACRSDGLPFTPDDWACLCEFQEYLDETQMAQEHLYHTNKGEFTKWVGMWTANVCLKRDRPNPYAFSDLCPAFESRFPLGVSVRACGIAAKPELNGKVGTVRRHDEAKLRVGVEFPPPVGLLSIKHTNLEMPDGGKARADALVKKHADKSGRAGRSR